MGGRWGTCEQRNMENNVMVAIGKTDKGLLISMD